MSLTLILFFIKKRLLRKNRRRKKVKIEKSTPVNLETNSIEESSKPPRKLRKVIDFSNLQSYGDDVSSTTSFPTSSFSRPMSPVKSEISPRLSSGVINHSGIYLEKLDKYFKGDKLCKNAIQFNYFIFVTTQPHN